MPPTTESTSTHPYEDGLPIAFIYQEPKHPPSFQLRIDCEEGEYNCCTSDWEQIKGEIRSVRDSLVFLDESGLDGMKFGLKGDREKCRPFSEEEKKEALAA
ncbi:MAG: hypothetical protein WCT53_05435 [Candidatus Gracilibacteria bacterium]